jgi:hypothetical protein
MTQMSSKYVLLGSDGCEEVAPSKRTLEALMESTSKRGTYRFEALQGEQIINPGIKCC